MWKELFTSECGSRARFTHPKYCCFSVIACDCGCGCGRMEASWGFCKISVHTEICSNRETNLFHIPYNFNNESLSIKYIASSFRSHREFEREWIAFHGRQSKRYACCYWPCILLPLQRWCSIVYKHGKHSYFTFICKQFSWTSHICLLEVTPIPSSAKASTQKPDYDVHFIS